MLKLSRGCATALMLGALLLAPTSAIAGGSGVGTVPQGTQTDTAYATSFAVNKVTNVFATTQQVSCYRPEVPFGVSDGPNDGYSGESPCQGVTTGEDIGTTPYSTQKTSNPGYPSSIPILFKHHSQSNFHVHPPNPKPPFVSS